jgi:hypothetical protein
LAAADDHRGGFQLGQVSGRTLAELVADVVLDDPCCMAAVD